jgi:hypothetical protein
MHFSSTLYLLFDDLASNNVHTRWAVVVVLARKRQSAEQLFFYSGFVCRQLLFFAHSVEPFVHFF